MKRFFGKTTTNTNSSSAAAAASSQDEAPTAPLLLRPVIVGGQVANAEGVCLGHAPEVTEILPAAAAASAAPENASASAAASSPEPMVTVTGRVVGAGSEASSSHTVETPYVTVMCARCHTSNTMVPRSTATLTCTGCRVTLQNTNLAALHLVCHSCRVRNLVAPGTCRIKCGNCQTLNDVPGPAADAQRTLLAREQAQMQEAKERSLEGN